MPIYEYHCPNCDCKQEKILSFSEAGIDQLCQNCGIVMKQLVSIPAPAIMVVTNREKAMKGLNKEEGGYIFPGGENHRKRYEQVMWEGLEQRPPVIGVGF